MAGRDRASPRRLPGRLQAGLEVHRPRPGPGRPVDGPGSATGGEVPLLRPGGRRRRQRRGDDEQGPLLRAEAHHPGARRRRAAQDLIASPAAPSYAYGEPVLASYACFDPDSVVDSCTAAVNGRRRSSRAIRADVHGRHLHVHRHRRQRRPDGVEASPSPSRRPPAPRSSSRAPTTSSRSRPRGLSCS